MPWHGQHALQDEHASKRMLRPLMHTRWLLRRPRARRRGGRRRRRRRRRLRAFLLQPLRAVPRRQGRRDHKGRRRSLLAGQRYRQPGRGRGHARLLLLLRRRRHGKGRPRRRERARALGLARRGGPQPHVRTRLRHGTREGGLQLLLGRHGRPRAGARRRRRGAHGLPWRPRALRRCARRRRAGRGRWRPRSLLWRRHGRRSGRMGPMAGVFGGRLRPGRPAPARGSRPHPHAQAPVGRHGSRVGSSGRPSVGPRAALTGRRSFLLARSCPLPLWGRNDLTAPFRCTAGRRARSTPAPRAPTGLPDCRRAGAVLPGSPPRPAPLANSPAQERGVAVTVPWAARLPAGGRRVPAAPRRAGRGMPGRAALPACVHSVRLWGQAMRAGASVRARARVRMHGCVSVACGDAPWDPAPRAAAPLPPYVQGVGLGRKGGWGVAPWGGVRALAIQCQ
jgi:hypothetical protein